MLCTTDVTDIMYCYSDVIQKHILVEDWCRLVWLEK